MSDSSDDEPQNKKRDQWDTTYEPLMKVLMAKKGIEQREASEVDKKKVEFFRGKDFCEFLQKHDSVLKRRCQKALDAQLEGRCPADDDDCAKLGQQLIAKGFIVRAQYKPLVEKKAGDDSVNEKKKKKWPDRLVRMSGNTFDPQGFYIILWEGSHTFRYIMLALVILGIIAACMFQVWPIWARIAAWYVAFVFCILYFCLEFSRLGCFCLGWVVGVDFWILPNFNDEYAGILDSLKPLYSFERRKDGMFMLVSRFAVLAIVGIAIEELSKTTSVSDVQDFIEFTLEEINQWGKNKATGMLAGPTEKAALPSIEDLENMDIPSASDAAAKTEEPIVLGGEEEAVQAEEVVDGGNDVEVDGEDTGSSHFNEEV